MTESMRTATVTETGGDSVRAAICGIAARVEYSRGGMKKQRETLRRQFPLDALQGFSSGFRDPEEDEHESGSANCRIEPECP